jgi:hypothetical protein
VLRLDALLAAAAARIGAALVEPLHDVLHPRSAPGDQ